MAGEHLPGSPPSRTATMLVIDGDSALDQLLKTVIQEFDLRLTLCPTSTQDLNFSVLASVLALPPVVVLVNLVVSRLCLYLLPEMQQMWPDARVIFISELDDSHLYPQAFQLGAYGFLPKPLEPVELGMILQRATQPLRTKQRGATAGT